MALKRIPIPTRIALEDEGARIALTWEGGATSEFRAFDLRAACPCAGCVDELTGIRTLRDDDVDPAVKAVTSGRVGRYAVAFQWSDGHSSGIYTYESLRVGRFGPDAREDGGSRA
jgi:ATP-binding protein involved in chromosome partitioning